MTLEIFWYLIIMLAIICYSVLDGFDLGVGILHPFARTDLERRTFLNAIGPVWDGNEVWLVIVVGALFAGFPEVYATLFSAFYLPTMILVFGLIFRAVSIEFRSKHPSKKWRQTWDYCFAGGSLVIAFGVGVVLGNLIEGLPLNENHDFIGSFSTFLRPYPYLLGITTVALFMMHGAIFLVMKTEGQLHDKLRKWVNYCIVFFMLTYSALTFVTISEKLFMVTRIFATPILTLIPVTALIAIIAVPLLMRYKFDGWAFLASCTSIALLLALFAIGTYPNMIRSTISPETNSLIIFNSSASELTLTVLAIIVAIGIPMVLAYGCYIYRTFRGKVRLDKTSY